MATASEHQDWVGVGAQRNAIADLLEEGDYPLLANNSGERIVGISAR